MSIEPVISYLRHKHGAGWNEETTNKTERDHGMFTKNNVGRCGRENATLAAQKFIIYAAVESRFSSHNPISQYDSYLLRMCCNETT